MGEKEPLLMKYMGNFSNTKCNESPAICSFKREKKSQDNVKLLEEMMIFKKKTAKRNAFELR